MVIITAARPEGSPKSTHPPPAAPLPRIVQLFIKLAPLLTALCIAVGVGWLFVLPLDDFSRRNYISENALLPGQVEAYFGGSELNIIKAYRAEIESWENSMDPNFYVAQFDEMLTRLQLKTGQQPYEVNVSGISVNGTNVYGILRAPRGDATEAIVLSSSWRTSEGLVDVGGVALLLSLAGYFKRWSLWSKDIIFLLVSEPMAGSALWLEAYHSDTPRYTSSLPLKSGEIQAAIQLSHPYGTHFNSISIMYDGTNGQLANLDLINSAVHIAGAQVRVPVTVQGMRTEKDRYEDRLRTLGKGMVQQGLGLGLGGGTFGRYKIDAITLQAVGGHGDHDDIAFGRVTESLCRSLNNLLEHLHQSFFFYFLLSPSSTTFGEPGRFVSIGTYLPAAMILAAGFTLTAIGLWMQNETLDSPLNDDEKSGVREVAPKSASSSIGFPLGVVAILHGLGFLVLASFDWIHRAHPALKPKTVSTLCHIIRFVEIVIPSILRSGQSSRISTSQPISISSLKDSRLIKSFSLLALGMFLSTLSTLNFSLGFFVGVLCSPLAFLAPLSSLKKHRLIATVAAIVVMELISPLNWFYLVAKLEFGGGVTELARYYHFAWNVWGAWMPLVWWCIWWPAWVAGLTVLAAPA